MAKRKETMSDLFMQFASVITTFGAATNALFEASVQTGLSVRGQLAWLIHQVEFFMPWGPAWAAAGASMQMALSTRLASAVIPRPEDPGFIAGQQSGAERATEGGNAGVTPLVSRYLPPVPIAAPQLSFYIESAADVPAWQNESCVARIAYTTVPIEVPLYTELLEVWGG